MHRNWQRSNISPISQAGAGQFRSSPDLAYSVFPSVVGGGETVSRNWAPPQHSHVHNYNAPDALGMNGGANYGTVGSYLLGPESQSWLPHNFNIEEGIDLPWGIPVPAAYQQQQQTPPPAAYSPTAYSASEYTPSSSSSDEVPLPDSDGSSNFPSQGSDFFCPASPTYAWSLPRMSPLSQGSPRNSQRSLSSASSRSSRPPSGHIEYQNTILTNEGISQLLFASDYYEYFSGSDSGGSQSQPEMKRMRFGN